MIRKAFTGLLALLGATAIDVASAQAPQFSSPHWQNKEFTKYPLRAFDPNMELPELPEAGSSSGGVVARSVGESVHEDLVKLAASLNNNPVAIFNHVRNNIDYEHYHGAKKGAELTFLEGSGNDFDTCALLAELLKAGGHTDIQYQYVRQWIDYSGNDGKNLMDWLGFAEEPHPGQTFASVYGANTLLDIWPGGGSEAVAKQVAFAYLFLRNRGTPEGEVYLSSNVVEPRILLSRMTLKLNWNGNEYSLDPSFKRYEKVAGIDIASASGYNQSTKDRTALLTTASVNSTTGPGYIASLNEANINTFLNSRLTELYNSLGGQNLETPLNEIVGGRKIIKATITDLSQAYLLGASDMIYLSNEVPDEFKAKVTFKIGGATHSEFLPDLAGRKIYFAASSNTVQLWLDDVNVFSTTVTTSDYTMDITVEHSHFAPFAQLGTPETGLAPHSESKVYKKNDSYGYAILYGYGSPGKLLRKRHAELRRHLLTDPEGDDRAARSEILNIMGLTWLYQTHLANELLASRNDISMMHHHRFGRMAQEQGFYIDVGLQFSGATAFNGVNDDRYDNVFHLGSMFASAMEHGVIEQLQPGSSAVSTVNIIRKANSISDKRIYVINKALVTSGADWTTAKGQLTAYSNNSTKNNRYDRFEEPFTDSNGNGIWDAGESYTDLTELGRFEYVALNGGEVVNGINTGGTIIIPKNRQVSQGNWQGTGYVLRSINQAGMIISGGYSGGYSVNYGWVAPAPVYNWSNYNPSYSYEPVSYSSQSFFTPPSFSTPSLFGADPVDMATGAFTLANTDMETGLEGAPRGLSFARYYTSNSRDDKDQSIGYGWTHSLHVRAAERTASEDALGLSTPRHAAAFLTAMTIGSDLYRRGSTAKEQVLTNFVTSWFLDRLTNNAVSIVMGQQNYQFYKKTDGTYESPAGSTMTLERVGTPPDHTYKLTQRNSNVFIFEEAAGISNGSEQRLREIKDQDSRTMHFSYLSAAPVNRLNYVEDEYGRRYTFRYDTSNRIDRITDNSNNGDVSESRYIGFAYDAEGNLVTYTDPRGKNTYYDYTIPAGQSPSDPSATTADKHLIVRHRNHDNQIITQNVYDIEQRVKEQYLHGDTNKTYRIYYTDDYNYEVNPEGGASFYYYDDKDRATGTKDASGNQESWTYDEHDRITSKTTGAGETTSYHYDIKHNLIQIDHPRGGGSTFVVYDSLSRIDLVTDPDGNQTDYVYNSGNTKNRPDKIIDPTGTTTYAYHTSGGGYGRVWKVTDQDGLVTEYGYDGDGHPDYVKAPGSFTTQYSYTERGDLREIENPNGIITRHTYNESRQVVESIVDPGANQSVTSFSYDNQGNLTTNIAPADNGGQRYKVRQEFSPTNKVLTTRTSDEDGEGPNDPLTQIIYDRRDWQLQILDPMNRITQFYPHPNGNPYVVTKPFGRSTITTFDGDNRPLVTQVPGTDGERATLVTYGTSVDGYPMNTVRTPDMLSVSETQDRSGRTRFYKNRKNNIWEFRYDALGRKTHVITPLDAAASRFHRTEYTHRGTVKKVTEPSGQIATFAYHATNGRLSSVTDGVGTITHTLYDNNGNLRNTSETRTGVTGAKTTERTYDRQDRLLTRKDENGQTIGYRYYPSGKVYKIIYPGGTETGVGHVEYTWYNSGNLKSVIDKLDSTTTPRITTYHWSIDGKLTKVVRPNGTTREIKYDEAGRPDVVEEFGPGSKLIFAHKHGYYPSDELAWKYELPSKRTSGTDPPGMPAMTYNADNQLSTWNGMSVGYDADGNLTSGPSPDGSGITSYTYDSRNRLISALGASHVYDADGHRVSSTSGGVTTNFTVDVSSKLSKVLVRTKGGVTTRYVWGVGLLYEVNGTGGSAVTTSYHHDATGNTIALSNASGQVVERIAYDAFGKIRSRVNVGSTLHDTPFLFTGFFGNQTDASGLLFMRARYYHPLMGRFLNVDPAREGMNWYGYAAGNPIGFVDPMGLGIESALDSIQSVLSYLGMVPVFGAVFDVINGAISIGRGNYVDAAISFASALPGIGDAVGGMKIAAGGYKAASSVFGGFQAAAPFRPALNISSSAGAPSLPASIAKNFTGGQAERIVLSEPMTFTRFHGGDAGRVGSWMSDGAFDSRRAVRQQLALSQDWGNRISKMSTVELPAGTAIWQGTAASVLQKNGKTLRGGGSQIWVESELDPSWFGNTVHFR